MALMQVEYYSEVMALSCSMNVIVPQQMKRSGGIHGGNFQKPYPVLYLLHGGSDNHASWMRNTAIERYVSGKGIVVVMPSVHYSFYADQKHGLKYFTHISEELPEIVKHFFPVSDKREDTFAAGISMGGYGAFKLGIRCPERFAAAASISGSVDQRQRLTEDADMHSIRIQMAQASFGSAEEYDQSGNDLFWLLERHLENGVQLPKFYQSCGTSDFNFDVNAAFYEKFKGRIDLTYSEVPCRAEGMSGTYGMNKSRKCWNGCHEVTRAISRPAYADGVLPGLFAGRQEIQ